MKMTSKSKKRQLQVLISQDSSSKSAKKSVHDHYQSHFNNDLDDNIANFLLTTSYSDSNIAEKQWPVAGIGRAVGLFRSDELLEFDPLNDDVSLEQLGVRKHLRDHVHFDEPQMSFYRLLARYVDVLLPAVNPDRLRPVYCLHALNHALRTRRIVVQHSERLRHLKHNNPAFVSGDEFRDQGLARPKVLILCPFRKVVVQLIDIFTDLLFAKDTKVFVTNQRRFDVEFGAENAGHLDRRIDVADDFRRQFSGNVDDCFRLGVGIGKKSLKLYTNFHNSDLIFASPLGLRMAVGDADESHHDHDFLAGIEMIVLDQPEVMLMQNWHHVLHLFDNVHVKPSDSHGLDLSRVRLWALEGRAKLFRQTLVLSSFAAPEFRALFSSQCSNRAGFVHFKSHVHVDGVLTEIAGHFVQAFHRMPSLDAASEPSVRFDYFVSKILPQCLDGSLRRTLVFVPSYYDFVRLRNHLKRQNASFVQVHEYATNSKIARARDLFFHGKRPLMLLTERFHFYRRYPIKGAVNLVFYQLPVWPKFYSQLATWLMEYSDSTPTCTVLFSSLDAIRLANVIGQQRARQLLLSDKLIHMVVTDAE